MAVKNREELIVHLTQLTNLRNHRHLMWTSVFLDSYFESDA